MLDPLDLPPPSTLGFRSGDVVEVSIETHMDVTHLLSVTPDGRWRRARCTFQSPILGRCHLTLVGTTAPEKENN